MGYNGLGHQQGFCSAAHHAHHGHQHLAQELLVLLDSRKLPILHPGNYLHLRSMPAIKSTLGSLRQRQMLESRVPSWLLLVHGEYVYPVVLRGLCLSAAMSQGNVLTSAEGFLAFTDVCLAVIPITIVQNLQLSLKKKVGLSFLLGMGILYEPLPCSMRLTVWE